MSLLDHTDYPTPPKVGVSGSCELLYLPPYSRNLNLIEEADSMCVRAVPSVGLDVALSEVTPTTLPPGTLDRFRYNRFNEDYHHIHAFCKLFLEGASFSEESGPFDFQTFLIDMDKLTAYL